MSLVVEGLRSDVLSVGELGDDTVAEVAERIAHLLGRSLPGRVLELLSEVAAELSSGLPEGRVEIRVAGDDVELAYVEEDRVGSPAADEVPDVLEGGDLSARITLRLSEGLKSRVEAGAAREGLSVNAYIVRTLERGIVERSGTERAGGEPPARLRLDVKGSKPSWTRHSTPRDSCDSSSRTTSAWWP